MPSIDTRIRRLESSRIAPCPTCESMSDREAGVQEWRDTEYTNRPEGCREAASIHCELYARARSAKNAVPCPDCGRKGRFIAEGSLLQHASLDEIELMIVAHKRLIEALKAEAGPQEEDDLDRKIAELDSQIALLNRGRALNSEQEIETDPEGKHNTCVGYGYSGYDTIYRPPARPPAG